MAKGMRAFAIAAMGIVILTGGARRADAAGTRRVSLRTDGGQAQYGHCRTPAISATGRFVVFESTSFDLAPGDAWDQQIYLRDRETPLTERISVSSAGVAGNYGSLHGSVSADGRFVVFQSSATNLVTPETSFSRFHVYLRDRQEGTTLLISAAPGGAEGNAHSRVPVISADGRYVAFQSGASNLTDPPVGNREQILRWDRLTGETLIVSLSVAGAQASASCEAPAISEDGNRIAFQTLASLEPRDQTNNQDIYLRDVAAGTTQLASVGWNGNESSNLHCAHAAISGDGHCVAFDSGATNLVDGMGGGIGYDQIFVRNIDGAFTIMASINAAEEQGNSYSYYPALNGDGSAVSFESASSNLVTDSNGWADVFVHRGGMPGTIERVSVRDESLLVPGQPNDGNGWSWLSAIDASGLITAFESWSTDLVVDDTNGLGDIFVRASDPLAVDPLTPDALALSAWPNPLRGEGGVDLRFTLPRAASVRAEVFDLAGRAVRLLAEGSQQAGEGRLHWDGRDAVGRRLPAGLYLLRLSAGDAQAARKLLLLP